MPASTTADTLADLQGIDPGIGGLASHSYTHGDPDWDHRTWMHAFRRALYRSR
jgi:hypothetical protein